MKTIFVNMFSLHLFFVITLFISVGSFGQVQCQNLFQNETSFEPQKNHFVKSAVPTKEAILKKLDALVLLEFQLRSGQFENENQRRQAQDFFIKELNQIIQIDRKYIDIFRSKYAEKKEALQTSAKKRADKERKEKEKRAEIIKEQNNPLRFAKQKMIFHEIKPGKFMMGETHSQVETEITKPFQLMSTQVTQMQWARLMIAMGERDLNKINPSNNKEGTDSQTIAIEGINVQMKPDHPVEQVSWDDVSEYIVGLNKLSNSNDPNVQKLLQQIIPDHKKGDVYDLPTEAQWEFVMRDRGNANNKYFDKADDSEVSQYGWHNENAGGQTHAVAQLNPRMIDSGDGIRRPFYDMEGNVWEWNKDLYGNLQGGKDPQGATTGPFRVYRGGGFVNGADYLRSGLRFRNRPGYRGSSLGFRLARTRP